MACAAGGALARDDEVKLSGRAWACSTLYSRYPIKVLNGENRETALCLGEGKKGRKHKEHGCQRLTHQVTLVEAPGDHLAPPRRQGIVTAIRL